MYVQLAAAARRAGAAPAAAPLPAAPAFTCAPPLPGDKEICVAGLRAAYEYIEKAATDVPVLVHCSAGKDRTGLVLAYYLMRTRQMSAQQAIAEVRSVRPAALSANGWEEFAYEVLLDAAV